MIMVITVVYSLCSFSKLKQIALYHNKEPKQLNNIMQVLHTLTHTTCAHSQGDTTCAHTVKHKLRLRTLFPHSLSKNPNKYNWVSSPHRWVSVTSVLGFVAALSQISRSRLHPKPVFGRDYKPRPLCAKNMSYLC